MEKRNRFRLQLLGVALGILAALLIWPATRWLVCAQLACLVPGNASSSASSESAAASGLISTGGGTRLTHRVAASLPDDFTIQLADAITYSPTGVPDSKVKVAQLRELARRFPDRPSVYANILRFANQGAVMVRRDEEFEMVGPAAKPGRYNGRHADPEQLAAYDRDAAEGERLDPDNAFFPCLRAVGLFAAHRDSDALAALHRAAGKLVWAEYYDDEVDGEVRLQERAFGQRGALPRLTIYAGILLPQYAQIRAVCRMAVVKAMEAERAGRDADGIAIREDVMRCGGLIRADARTMIGNLVGSAVAIAAMQRPGAAPFTTAHSGLQDRDGVKMRERLVAQYDAFLERSGHTETSAYAHFEVAAANKLREISHSVTDHDVFGAAYLQLGAAWWADLQLLCAALWTLVIGGIAAIAYRNPHLRSGLCLPRWAGRGALLGAIAALGTGVFMFPAATPPTAVWLGSAVGFALLAFALPAKDKSERLRTLGGYVLSLAAMGCFVLLYVGHVTATVDPTRKVLLILSNLSEMPEQRVEPGIRMLFMGGGVSNLAFHLLTIFAVGFVPLVAAFTFVIISRANRVPVSVALIRGFRGCAVPLACALFIAYAAMLPWTLKLESAIDDGIRQTLNHEGRYYATLAGKQWPGRMP